MPGYISVIRHFCFQHYYHMKEFKATLWINTGSRPTLVHTIGTYTDTVAPMYVDAFNSPLGLLAANNLTPRQASEIVTNAELTMYHSPKYYREMDPQGGYGDQKGARLFLEKIWKACDQHSSCTLKIELVEPN